MVAARQTNGRLAAELVAEFERFPDVTPQLARASLLYSLRLLKELAAQISGRKRRAERILTWSSTEHNLEAPFIPQH